MSAVAAVVAVVQVLVESSDLRILVGLGRHSKSRKLTEVQLFFIDSEHFGSKLMFKGIDRNMKRTNEEVE